MHSDALSACYDRLLWLLDQTDAAIDRQDMDALCLHDEEAMRLTAEIETLSKEAAGSLGDAHVVTRMETVIRKTLRRLGETQMRVARWSEETGAALGRLTQGVTAVRTYAPPVQTGTFFADRQA